MGSRPPHNLGRQKSDAWQLRAAAAGELAVTALETLAAERTLNVVDLGCGDRKLEPVLRAVLGTRLRYRGYDLVPQHTDTEAADLSRSLPAGPFDLAFCLGVIEYLPEPDVFLERAAAAYPRLVLSYTVSDSGRYGPEAVRRKGWRHHLSAAEIEELMSAHWEVLQRTEIDGGRTVLWSLRRRASQ